MSHQASANRDLPTSKRHQQTNENEQEQDSSVSLLAQQLGLLIAEARLDEMDAWLEVVDESRLSRISRPVGNAVHEAAIGVEKIIRRESDGPNRQLQNHLRISGMHRIERYERGAAAITGFHEVSTDEIKDGIKRLTCGNSSDFEQAVEILAGQLASALVHPEVPWGRGKVTVSSLSVFESELFRALERVQASDVVLSDPLVPVAIEMFATVSQTVRRCLEVADRSWADIADPAGTLHDVAAASSEEPWPDLPEDSGQECFVRISDPPNGEHSHRAVQTLNSPLSAPRQLPKLGEVRSSALPETDKHIDREELARAQDWTAYLAEHPQDDA